MQTYPSELSSGGRVTAFEIENVYASPGAIARILRGIDGVSDVRKRRPFTAFDEIHIRFCFRGVECVVWEPFGDNSRYWIGPHDVPEPPDLAPVEQAFRDYSPPIHRQLIGDILSMPLFLLIVAVLVISGYLLLGPSRRRALEHQDCHPGSHLHSDHNGTDPRP